MCVPGATQCLLCPEWGLGCDRNTGLHGWAGTEDEFPFLTAPLVPELEAFRLSSLSLTWYWVSQKNPVCAPSLDSTLTVTSQPTVIHLLPSLTIIALKH